MASGNISLELIIAIVIGSLIWIWILYEVIRSAVKSAMKEQNRLLKQQNEILIKILNVKGVDKDELMDLFLQEKKDFWQTLKNH